MAHAHSTTAPGTDDKRTLRIHEPAELLAHVGLLMGAVPRDSVALLGIGDASTTGLALRSDLDIVLGDSGVEMLDHMLGILGQHGAREAAAIVVLGDGYDDRDQEEMLADGAPAAATMIRAAGGQGDIEIGEVWIVGGGTAWRLRLAEPPYPGAPWWETELELRGPEILADEESTLVAAQAVAAGESLPRSGADPVITRLAPVLADLSATARRVVLPRPPLREVWADALAALAAPGVVADEGDRAAIVTACERIIDLVGDIASVACRDQMMALMVGRGHRPGELTPDEAISIMTGSQRRPHSSVCAGGEWYETLRRIEESIRPEEVGGVCSLPARMVNGWASVSCLLALMAWWNHRFATAGALVDRVLALRPEHSLARLADVMASRPVAPGWMPLRS